MNRTKREKKHYFPEISLLQKAESSLQKAEIRESRKFIFPEIPEYL